MGRLQLPNERIAFASFMNQRMPAIARWREREAEVLGSPRQVDYESPLPELARRRPAGIPPCPPASAAYFRGRGPTSPHSFVMMPS